MADPVMKIIGMEYTWTYATVSLMLTTDMSWHLRYMLRA